MVTINSLASEQGIRMLLRVLSGEIIKSFEEDLFVLSGFIDLKNHLTSYMVTVWTLIALLDKGINDQIIKI